MAVLVKDWEGHAKLWQGLAEFRVSYAATPYTETLGHLSKQYGYLPS